MSAARRPAILRPTPGSADFTPFEIPAVASFHRGLSGFKATPLVSLPGIAQQLDLKAVYIKDESGRFGLPSFKILGASWGVFCAIAAKLKLPLDSELEIVASKAREAGLVLFAATDGNHGQAVACMARLLSVEARIHVPRSASEHTKDAISGEGATIVVGSGDYDDVVRYAAEAASASPGGILVQDTSFPGYEDTPARIVEGYSTMLEEIDSQLARLNMVNDVVITPVGVGSLAHAVLRHSKSRGRQRPAKVITVEPDTAACLYKNLQKGSQGPSASIRTSETIMTGMDCGTVSHTAWPDLRSHVDGSVTVSDFEAHCAVEDLKVYGVKSGPCGASGLAALRYLATNYREETGLHGSSVVVLLNTEGKRPYVIPQDVASDDPVELTQILTRIESANPTLSQSEGSSESIIADYIEAWLQHRDIESHRHEGVIGRPSIVGVVPGTGSGRSLVINGHTDTVSLAGYTRDPLSRKLTEKDGPQIVSGRGSLDMKAGIAAAMTDLSNTKKNLVPGTVLLAAVADEEDLPFGTEEALAAG